MSPIPRLDRLDNGAYQLIVADQPFLMRPAELNNSSFSSSTYMAEAYPRLVANKVNTVLGSVSWEQIEPQEGEFEFDELDHVILGAKQSGLKLVILWFGAFKNGMSLSYVPHFPLRWHVTIILDNYYGLITRSIDLRAWMGQDRLEAVPTGSSLKDSWPETSHRGCVFLIPRSNPQSRQQCFQETDAAHQRAGRR